MVEGRADDVDVVVLGLDAEEEEDAAEPDGGVLGGCADERPVDALGVAGGARGVVHDVADGAVGRVVGRLG